MDTSTAISADIRTRIVEAAADLYEQSGRQNLPTVDAVRRAARVDMNSASAVMREWRRAQTTQATPVTVQVPEAVQQSSGQALATLWAQAQELANESLRAAQTAWETERTELDGMRQELAIAYESQAGELEAAQALTVEVRQSAQEAASAAAAELAGVRVELVAATTRAERAEAKVGEIEHRASDLRAELDRAHQDADQARTELARQTTATQAATAERDQARTELVKVQARAEAAQEAQQAQCKTVAQEAQRAAERLTKAEADQEQARKEASAAREEAAQLRGQTQALQDQAAELMRVLASRQEPVVPRIA